jgi:transposase
LKKTKGLQPVLKNTGWVLLERPENLSEKQEIRLADLLRHDLKTVRAYRVLRRNLSFFRSMVSASYSPAH